MLFQRLNRLERLNRLIRTKSTGSAKDLARRFGCTDRTVRNMMDELRDFGAEIKYCNRMRSYYYNDPVSLCFDPNKIGSRKVN